MNSAEEIEQWRQLRERMSRLPKRNETARAILGNIDEIVAHLESLATTEGPNYYPGEGRRVRVEAPATGWIEVDLDGDEEQQAEFHLSEPWENVVIPAAPTVLTYDGTLRSDDPDYRKAIALANNSHNGPVHFDP